MDMWKMPVIQGDVMLIPHAIPDQVTRQDGTRHVLAEGEVTGHVHLATEAELAVAEAERYLTAHGGAMLDHADHGPVPVLPQTYIVRRQIEVDLLGGFRQVAD